MYGENMANMANMANMPNMPNMTSPYGYEPCHYGYSYPVAGVENNNCGFALIVVLFILLIIIGATCYSKY